MTTTEPAVKKAAPRAKSKTRLSRRGIIAIGAAALVAIAAVVVIVVVNSGPVPYDDDRSTGQLALYDSAGNPVTSGSINDKPFVSYAVSLQKAPTPYDRPGGKAALLAFQPRQGIAPSEWGGDFLTGSTPYSDPNHPIAHGTDEDISLANFLAEFPTQWDGLIQLRIYLGAPQLGGLTSSYVTADIKVSGDTWTLVRGATSSPGGITGANPSPTVTGKGP